jgi:hypothetical protein
LLQFNRSLFEKLRNARVVDGQIGNRIVSRLSMYGRLIGNTADQQGNTQKLGLSQHGFVLY